MDSLFSDLRDVLPPDFSDPDGQVNAYLNFIQNLTGNTINFGEQSEELLRNLLLLAVVEGLTLGEIIESYSEVYFAEGAEVVLLLLQLANMVVGLERELSETRNAVTDSVDAIRDALDTENPRDEISIHLDLLESMCGESAGS